MKFTPIGDQVSPQFNRDKTLAEAVKNQAHIVCPVCNKKSFMLYLDLDMLEEEAECDDRWTFGVAHCVQVETILNGYPDYKVPEGDIVADICSSCSTVFTVQEYTNRK